MNGPPCENVSSTASFNDARVECLCNTLLFTLLLIPLSVLTTLNFHLLPSFIVKCCHYLTCITYFWVQDLFSASHLCLKTFLAIWSCFFQFKSSSKNKTSLCADWFVYPYMGILWLRSVDVTHTLLSPYTSYKIFYFKLKGIWDSNL